MPQRKELNISYTLINTTIYTTLFSRPHKEMKLKSDSLSVTAGVFCFSFISLGGQFYIMRIEVVML